MTTSEQFLGLRIGFNTFFLAFFGIYPQAETGMIPPWYIHTTLVCVNTLPPVHVHVQIFQAGNPCRVSSYAGLGQKFPKRNTLQPL